MYEDLRGRLEELAKIELHDDGMGVYRISAEGLEVIKGLAQAAEAAIEDLSEQINEQEVTPEAEHFIDKYADRILSELQELKGSIKEKPRWIPVTERLPSPMRAVLVYAPYKQNIFMAYLQGEKWYVWGPDEYCCQRWPEYHAITHWMNLPQNPEPPKEET